MNHSFISLLFSWYELNKRDLPFRDTKDAYKIWLSEIILQQTRVAQGLPYYNRFVEKFPKVTDLAKAEEEEVLNLWQGLGYYSRARNLHFTAKHVVEHLNGVFPVDYKTLLSLKGIGDYTASAIASFSSKEVVPALDGNVYRFVSRLYGIETPINTPKANKEFKIVLNELIDHKQPDQFNQAMIEFGALHCVPSSPDCDSCPFQSKCFAFSKNKISEFPVKLKKNKPVNRFLNFYAVFQENSVFLTKRTKKGIWQNLYEFPNSESELDYESELLPDFLTNNTSLVKVGASVKHLLSHQRIQAKLFVLKAHSGFEIQEDWERIDTDKMKELPIHRLMEKMVEAELSDVLDI